MDIAGTGPGGTSNIPPQAELDMGAGSRAQTYSGRLRPKLRLVIGTPESEDRSSPPSGRG